MTTLTAVADAKGAARKDSKYDAVLLVGERPSTVSVPALRTALTKAADVDKAFDSRTALWPVPAAAGGRVIVAPTGTLSSDHQDVRSFSEAAGRGIRLAREAGARRVLLLVMPSPSDGRFVHAARIAALGARGALWEPLEAREALGKSIEPVRTIGVALLDDEFTKEDADFVTAVDDGLRLAKDLGGTEPERMAPRAFADYVRQAFVKSGVKVSIVKKQATLNEDYPLLSAVARASWQVKRHQPCVVRLEYTGSDPVEKTFLFAGKGVTYDTGGADLKVGGHMAGMSRDKGGAAAVAGLLLTAARLKLPGVKLIAELGMVRNSIGAEAFVSDEIVTSHAGARVRIGNTDAEGRLVLADLLSHLREQAKKEKKPHLLSVATLTGHAGRAVGPYSIALDNGPARQAGIADSLGQVGDLWADPFEVSRLRREDFAFVRPRTKADDVLQCNNAASSMTARGHQFPMAFLAIAAGLDKHGNDSRKSLPFTHIDVGGSGAEDGDWQHGNPTGKPLVALLTALLQ